MVELQRAAARGQVEAPVVRLAGTGVTEGGGAARATDPYIDRAVGTKGTGFPRVADFGGTESGRGGRRCVRDGNPSGNVVVRIVQGHGAGRGRADDETEERTAVLDDLAVEDEVVVAVRPQGDDFVGVIVGADVPIQGQGQIGAAAVVENLHPRYGVCGAHDEILVGSIIRRADPAQRGSAAGGGLDAKGYGSIGSQGTVRARITELGDVKRPGTAVDDPAAEGTVARGEIKGAA